MTYSVVFKRAAQKMIGRLPSVYRDNIRGVLRSLAADPTPPGCVRLTTERRGNFFRIRVGQYRIIYEVAHEIRIITVIRVGHRKAVYRNL